MRRRGRGGHCERPEGGKTKMRSSIETSVASWPGFPKPSVVHQLIRAFSGASFTALPVLTRKFEPSHVGRGRCSPRRRAPKPPSFAIARAWRGLVDREAVLEQRQLTHWARRRCCRGAVTRSRRPGPRARPGVVGLLVGAAAGGADLLGAQPLLGLDVVLRVAAQAVGPGSPAPATTSRRRALDAGEAGLTSCCRAAMGAKVAQAMKRSPLERRSWATRPRSSATPPRPLRRCGAIRRGREATPARARSPRQSTGFERVELHGTNTRAPLNRRPARRARPPRGRARRRRRSRPGPAASAARRP